MTAPPHHFSWAPRGLGLQVLGVRHSTVLVAQLSQAMRGPPPLHLPASSTVSAWGQEDAQQKKAMCSSWRGARDCSRPLGPESLFPGLVLEGLRSTSTWRKLERLHELTLNSLICVCDLSSPGPSKASVKNHLLYCILFICFLIYCSPTQGKGYLCYKFCEIEIRMKEGRHIKDGTQKKQFFFIILKQGTKYTTCYYKSNACLLIYGLHYIVITLEYITAYWLF